MDLSDKAPGPDFGVFSAKGCVVDRCVVESGSGHRGKGDIEAEVADVVLGIKIMPEYVIKIMPEYGEQNMRFMAHSTYIQNPMSSPTAGVLRYTAFDLPGAC